MSGQNGAAIFLSVYGEVTARHNRSFVPEEAAAGISEATGADIEDVRTMLQHPPAAGSLYPDVPGFLTGLAATDGQHVSIWTQGEMATAQGGPGYQVKKIGQAGISGMLNPGGWRTENRAVGLPRVLGDIYDKSIALPGIVAALVEADFESVVIVDDSPTNHARARQTLQGEGWDAVEHFLMARSGVNGHRGGETPLSVVESFDEISLEGYAGSRVLWLLDLDYTLIDHKQVVELYSRRMEELTGITA